MEVEPIPVRELTPEEAAAAAERAAAAAARKAALEQEEAAKLQAEAQAKVRGAIEAGELKGISVAEWELLLESAATISA